MSKLSPLAVFLAATLITLWAKNAWAHETTPGAQQPATNPGEYAQPWPQRPYWPVPPWGYGQMPPPYPPPPGAYPAAPVAAAPVPAATATTEAGTVAPPPQVQQQPRTSHATEADEARAKLDVLRDKLQHSLESELALTKKITLLGSEQEALRVRVAELGTAHDQLQGELAGRDEQLAALQAELKTTTEALEQAQSELQALNDAPAAVNPDELAQLETRLEEQQASLLTAEQSCSEERNRLNAELASRDDKLAALQAELETTRQAAEQAFAEEREGLRSDIASRDRQLTALEAELQQAQASNGNSDEAFEQELTQLKAELEKQKAAQQTAEQAANSERDVLRADLADRDEQLTSLKAELQAANDSLQQARAALTTAEAEADQLRQSQQATSAAAEPVAEIATLQTGVRDTDQDNDGVADNLDLCSDTPADTAVEATGCAIDAAITLEGVHFGYDSYELNDKTRKVLDRVASILIRQPDIQLEVAGHTDSQGDPAYNEWLSLQRAETVRDYLVEQGLNPDHIGADGYGGKQPIADNSTREGLQANRRVELRRLQ